MEQSASETAASLREELKVLAASLQPFPTFLRRGWVQAVEVEPTEGVSPAGRGCVVVCPDGELYELVLRLLPGAELVSDPDPTEELVPLELPVGEYVSLARAAIDTLQALRDKGAPKGESSG